MRRTEALQGGARGDVFEHSSATDTLPLSGLRICPQRVTVLSSFYRLCVRRIVNASGIAAAMMEN